MSIILTQSNSPAVRLSPSPFPAESNLQTHIAQHPECIPMDEIEEGLQLLVLGREFPTPSGPVDVLAMDSSGVLYLIETKLYNNPDKRKVVAQMLDYGAALWAAGTDSFHTALSTFLAKAGKKLPQMIQDQFGFPPEDAAETVEELQQSVSGGRIRFVVLMDKLHDPLKDLILFLNENSKFQLLAIEVECYRHRDMLITIPRMFGAQTKGGGGIKAARWDQMSMKEDLDGRGMLPEHRQLVDWSMQFAKTLESEGVATVAYGEGNKPSQLVRGQRNLVFRTSLAKSHVQAVVALEMRCWNSPGPGLEAALKQLSAALGVQVSLERGRIVPITEPLLKMRDRIPAEHALRGLVQAL